MSPEEANVEDYQWYRLVEGSAPLVQGDMLDGCPVVVPKAGEEGDEMVSEIHYYDVVVMSQSCDLEHDKVRLVLVCPVWPLESLAKRSVQLASRKGKENLRRGHFPGYHLLHECWNAPGRVDMLKGGCSIGPEVRIESGTKASEDLHA